MRKLLLIGGGGHCRACIDVIRQTNEYEIVGILDIPEKIGNKIDGVTIVGADAEIKEWSSKVDECLISIGHVGSSDKRQQLYEQLYEQLQAENLKFATVISPRAYIAETANVSDGTIIMHDVMINAGANIGENCIINSKALIEHDANIGSHTHISTRATVNGGVNVGMNCFIGSHAMVFNNCEIGDNSVVGGGQVVRNSLSDNSKPSDISG